MANANGAAAVVVAAPVKDVTTASFRAGVWLLQQKPAP
jgi:hypothetical protein